MTRIHINKLFIVSCLAFLFFENSIFSANETRTNLEIVDELITNIARKISLSLDTISDNRTIYINVDEHPLKNLSESIFKSTLSNYNFKLTSVKENLTQLNISITKYRIYYRESKDNQDLKQYERTVSLKMIASISSEEGQTFAYSFQEEFKDALSYDDIPLVEKDGVIFFGEKPKEQESFLKKYLEPIIVISSSIVALVLFFTIRTK
ncbi:MAG: hypothetical protein N2517_05220 [Ignavibacteria bacterium]|nr:hypothetical protein [Ignavibacteria bacterium]